jgi:hypothetical protein
MVYRECQWIAMRYCLFLQQGIEDFIPYIIDLLRLKARVVSNLRVALRTSLSWKAHSIASVK